MISITWTLNLIKKRMIGIQKGQSQVIHLHYIILIKIFMIITTLRFLKMNLLSNQILKIKRCHL